MNHPWVPRMQKNSFRFVAGLFGAAFIFQSLTLLVFLAPACLNESSEVSSLYFHQSCCDHVKMMIPFASLDSQQATKKGVFKTFLKVAE